MIGACLRLLHTAHDGSRLHAPTPFKSCLQVAATALRRQQFAGCNHKCFSPLRHCLSAARGIWTHTSVSKPFNCTHMCQTPWLHLRCAGSIVHCALCCLRHCTHTTHTLRSALAGQHCRSEPQSGLCMRISGTFLTSAMTGCMSCACMPRVQDTLCMLQQEGC